ncbi:hypothetical protein BC826DRAFT_308373 [Russula brevipes]|nr:hypothetical protein BC826DRAFT_308373 [Russula brevipes]
MSATNIQTFLMTLDLKTAGIFPSTACLSLDARSSTFVGCRTLIPHLVSWIAVFPVPYALAVSVAPLALFVRVTRKTTNMVLLHMRSNGGVSGFLRCGSPWTGPIPLDGNEKGMVLFTRTTRWPGSSRGPVEPLVSVEALTVSVLSYSSHSFRLQVQWEPSCSTPTTLTHPTDVNQPQ